MTNISQRVANILYSCTGGYWRILNRDWIASKDIFKRISSQIKIKRGRLFTMPLKNVL
jgi:hypothetical protein